MQMMSSFIGQRKMIQTYLMVGDNLKYLSANNMQNANKSIDSLYITPCLDFKWGRNITQGH